VIAAPSAQQTEARFTQWWWEVGSKLPQHAGQRLDDYLSALCREAFHAGASYVATHAGLNESIKAADGGTGVTDDE
jgi:hypothetical protein